MRDELKIIREDAKAIIAQINKIELMSSPEGKLKEEAILFGMMTSAGWDDYKE